MPDDKKPLGVLILHGFTGSLDTVRAVVPVAEKLGLPWRMPVLRGHGTHYRDLVGVTQHDWLADGRAALMDLAKEARQVVIVGLSMGGLVALNLAADHPDVVAGLVVLTPAMRFSDPLAPFTPLLKGIFPFWPSPNSFADPVLAKNCTNYTRFPTATAGHLIAFGRETEMRLPQVKVPVTVLYSRKDTIVHPGVVKLLQDNLGSAVKEVVYFDRSGHEMLQDCEAEAVTAAIETALVKHLAAVTPAASA